MSTGMGVRLVVGLLLFASVPAWATTLTIEVRAGKDRTFCERVKELFGDRPDLTPLDAIVWKPVVLGGQAPKTRHCSALDQARIDLDHDGHLDLVVRTTFCMKGKPSDSLYVFPQTSPVLDQATWQDMTPLLSTPDKFERTGGIYPLSALWTETAWMPVLSQVFRIHPFNLDGRVYVSLSDERHEWIGIAKYLGGDRFEDLCYLKAERP